MRQACPDEAFVRCEIEERPHPMSGFYEDDEPIEDVRAGYEAGQKGVTVSSALPMMMRGISRQHRSRVALEHEDRAQKIADERMDKP